MKQYVINVEPLETRVALLEEGRLAELTIERQENRSVVGNIYKGRIDSVVPGIQAAFVDIGFDKNGFLYVSDFATPDIEGDMTYEDGAAKIYGSIKKGKVRSIEKMLRRGQELMVQVSKDTLGTKGVRLTTYITLPGRYVVYLPTVNTIGISRKIEDERERERLKRILQSIRPKEGGLILRTAAAGKDRADFLTDLKYVMKLWEKIRGKMQSVKAPCLLHEDLGPVLRIVRDCFTSDVQRLIIDNETEYLRILSFLDSFAPSLRRRCKLYTGKRPLFDKMGIETEIEKALLRRVELKSGGYICIDQTEALTAIDVNTGRFTGSTHLEDTALKTNLEAAEEIARQVRLRDLGGIIVIDFIDMEVSKHREQLIEHLTEFLKKDRAQTTLSEISELGMIEMTRKRVRHNLLKTLSQPCPYCDGSGMVYSVTTMTFMVLRRLRNLFCDNREKHVVLQVHPDVARRLKTENKDLLDSIAAMYGRVIEVESVSDFHIREIRVLSARTRLEIFRSH